MLADGSEYRGRYGRSVADLRDFHRVRLGVLAGTAADVLAVETIPELEEIEAVAGLLARAPRRRGLDRRHLPGRRPAPERRAGGGGRRRGGRVAGRGGGRRQLHAAGLRRGDRRADAGRDDAPDRGLPEQRRGLGRRRPALDGRAERARGRGGRGPMARRRCQPGGRLLPGDAGPDPGARGGHGATSGHNSPRPKPLATRHVHRPLHQEVTQRDPRPRVPRPAPGRRRLRRVLRAARRLLGRAGSRRVNGVPPGRGHRHVGRPSSRRSPSPSRTAGRRRRTRPHTCSSAPSAPRSPASTCSGTRSRPRRTLRVRQCRSRASAAPRRSSWRGCAGARD